MGGWLMDNPFYKSEAPTTGTRSPELHLQMTRPDFSFDLKPLALLVSTLVIAGASQAQTAPAAPQSPAPASAPASASSAPVDSVVRLKPTRMLSETIPDSVRPQLPSFVYGDRISGRTDLETTLDGHAEIRKGDTVLRADRIDYYQPDDQAKAKGNVFINRAGNTYSGTELQLRLDAFEGFFTDTSYTFLRTGAHGNADRIEFIDDKRSIVHNATYTTCTMFDESSWLPAWVIKATTIKLDNDEEVGIAENAVLTFKGVSTPPLPSISFPLSEKRKSGLLPPTIGIDSVSGLQITQPYYFNLAPNRDATFSPTVISKRGVNLGGDFRYLESNYKGQLGLNYLPSDKLRDRDRWSYTALHTGTVSTGWDSVPAVATYLNLNRVSDDNYWRDFPRSSNTLTQRLLAQDGSVSWGYGDLGFTARALKYQTLQDVNSVIVPPYDRLPQLVANYSRYNVGGLDYSVNGDYTKFHADRFLTNQPNAERSMLNAQISRPWQAPGWFFTPKAMFHAASYQFDAPLLSTGATSASVSVPTLSLDGGLIFERNSTWFGKDVTQTLEPRAFYVYTPFRNQNFLPNYDSAANDFNFAAIYTENAYGGYDRISDNNLLTLGVTSRFLDVDTGAELAKVGVAQRIRFEDQLVTLPGGTTVSDRFSDILVGGSLSFNPKWALDSTVQFNPKTERSIRSTIGGRYSPSNYRTISAAYRLQRGQSEQIDIGWQWPLNDLWGDKGKDLGPGRGQGGGRFYTVGRANYSMKDSRFVDTIVGLEYDGCCWIGRVVVERLQSSVTTANKRILFQLEFVGFSSVGSSPLKTLKENVPRYQLLRDQITTPSRFSSYD